MTHRSQWHLRVIGLTCLICLPVAQLRAAGLREEAHTYRTEGYNLQRAGDVDGAAAAYQKAIALDPTYPTPHNDLGIIFQQRGELERAKTAFQQAVELDASYAEAYANLALVYEQLGDRDQAIRAWTKFAQLNASLEENVVRRLESLGAFEVDPALRGKVFTRRHTIQQELKANEQTMNEFRATTEQRQRWPEPSSR